MKNDILMRINNRIKANQEKPKSLHKTDFFVHKNDIEKAIAAGHDANIIWQTLIEEDKITMAYRTFSRYVKKHIKSALQEMPNKKSSTATVSEKLLTSDPKISKPEQKGFQWNSKPDPKELFK